jgi:hypothetical protein
VTNSVILSQDDRSNAAGQCTLCRYHVSIALLGKCQQDVEPTRSSRLHAQHAIEWKLSGMCARYRCSMSPWEVVGTKAWSLGNRIVQTHQRDNGCCLRFHSDTALHHPRFPTNPQRIVRSPASSLNQAPCVPRWTAPRFGCDVRWLNV